MEEMTPKGFEAMGLPWPEPDAERGMSPNVRFSRCLTLERLSNTEMLRYHPFAPRPPEREVPARVETFVDDDGYEEERVTEWRTLSDEEYDDAFRKYEEALAAWQKNPDPGIAFVRGRPSTTGKFVLEDGSFAHASFCDERGVWFVTEHWHEH